MEQRVSASALPIIRRATLADAPALVELRLAFQDELGPIEDEDDLQAYRRAYQHYMGEKLASGELLIWVAEVAGQIVATGAIILIPMPPTLKNLSGLEAFVFNMYTLPAWRGQGLASRILDEIMSFVKTTGARRVWLYATEQGEPVYAQAGFTIKRRRRPEMELVF
ncbi:MAG TPA: GNAT family N-acetyltransferase [Ktedonobacterales bacterium]|jgi:GNAT superfamily N-acetyltransferase